MEATREEGGLLEKLQPPRLEDAGLEDCALPPESIREAFLKAATAVRSSAADDDETDATYNDCVKNPRRSTEEPSDSMIENWPKSYPPPGHCEAEKGGGMPEVLGDEAATSMTDTEERVVGTKAMNGGKACVDGLKGLKIGEKCKDEKEERES